MKRLIHNSLCLSAVQAKKQTQPSSVKEKRTRFKENHLFVLGNTFLVTLLRGEEENNGAAARSLLDLVGPELLNKLHVRACVDELYEKEIITEGDKEEIEAKEKQQGPIAATRLLIENLPRRNQRWTREFSAVLSKHGLKEIAKMFRLFEDKENGNMIRISEKML